MTDPAHTYAVEQYNLLTADMFDYLYNDEVVSAQPVVIYFEKIIQRHLEEDYARFVHAEECREELRIADEMANSWTNIKKAAR